MNKKRIIVLTTIVVCIGLLVFTLLNGEHSPQDCIRNIPESNDPISIAPPNNEIIKNDIIIVNLDEVVLYAYESVNDDIIVAQMKMKKNLIGIEEYSLNRRTFYWNKEWPVFGSVHNQTYDQKYEFWFTPETPDTSKAEKSYPVKVLL